MKTRKTFARSLVAAGLCAGLLTASPAQALVYRVTAAQSDPGVARYGGGHSFWMPDNNSHSNIPNGNSSKFVFMNDSGRLNVSDDMTSARMTGTIQSLGQSSSMWDVDIMFILGMGYDTYADGHADPNGDTRDGKAKRELKHNQYADHGGTVDPESWRYFYMDEGNATLTGALGGGYEGTTLDLYQRPNGRGYGKYVFQMGEGANGKNLNMGLSGWLGYTTAELGEEDDGGQSWGGWGNNGPGHDGYTGIGDINVDLEPIPEPISAGLAMMGLGALTVATRRRRK
jgi:PEP-CTERM motif-containing protein